MDIIQKPSRFGELEHQLELGESQVSDLNRSLAICARMKKRFSATTTMSNLEVYQNELIERAMSVGALKFGSFVLKSGRSASPTLALATHR